MSIFEGKNKIVKVFNETRRGKKVTIIAGLNHNPQSTNELAKHLKQQCAAGGTVEGKSILIQGDKVKEISQKLLSMNYIVK